MIYASDTPADWGEGLRFLVWADGPDEALPALYAVGADPDAARLPREVNAWEAYRVTPEQFADLCAMGLRVTDKFGPAEWLARRDGNARLLERLLTARSAGL